MRTPRTNYTQSLYELAEQEGQEYGQGYGQEYGQEQGQEQGKEYGQGYGLEQGQGPEREYGPIRNKIRQGIQKGLDKLAKLESTSFWAHQFSEHFKFIISILKANKDKVEVTPVFMAKLKAAEIRWANISDDPRLYKDNDYDKTLALKEEVKDLVSSLPCIPDLLTHMIEELNYFKNSVLSEEYNLQDEVSYWATEHAENLDFVNCELPQLIKEEGSYTWPRFLYRVFEDNKKLSSKFKEVAYNNQAGFLAGLGKVFGLGKDANVDPKDLANFMRLKEKHINGIDNLISHIPDLPLSPDTMKDLYEMLNHERNEAIFAFDRINTYDV